MANTIGILMKKLRQEKKFTLKQISEKTGLSISFLSQVERLKSSVTIESLTKIAEALNVSPSYFFANQASGRTIHRKEEEQIYDFIQTPFIYQGLSGEIDNPNFEPMLVTVLPSSQKAEPFTHNGQEFMYVLSGVLTVVYENEEIDLYPGDSFHVESTQPHNWYNRTNEPVKMVYVRS